VPALEQGEPEFIFQSTDPAAHPAPPAPPQAPASAPNSSDAGGGILAALHRSPLVGADLNLTRRREQGRNVKI
jgi:hypothetical protein